MDEQAGQSDASATAAGLSATKARAAGRGALLRYYLASGTFGVPQAAGPIVFALLAIPLTGDAGSGAAIVLAITVAQVVGAVPVARLGRRWNAVGFLRVLVGIRTLALGGVAVLAAAGAPFALLVAAAALAGLVNGAAFGYLRSVLNYLVEPSRMPRALGVSATLGEFTFVAAPVAASLLGTVDAVLALVVLSLLGAAPAVLLPAVPHAQAKAPVEGGGGMLSPMVLLWLGCTLANGAVVSSIEVGAVSLAVSFGFAPAMGFVFTVALCAASVAGGVWVSVRNRLPRRAVVVGYLGLMSAGAGLVAAQVSVVATVAAAVMIGCCMAPLSTYYTLMLDALSPAHRKAELFALARTMNAVGIILTSACLSVASLGVTQVVATGVMVGAAVVVGLAFFAGRSPRRCRQSS
jgi:hypothetical protein